MTHHFEKRDPDDRLDVVPLLRAGLLDERPRSLLAYEGRPVDARELRSRVASVQRQLHRAGVRRGDRVAVMLSNTVEHVATLYALMLYGAVWVPVNVKLRGAGLAYIMEHARPVLLLFEPQYADAVAGLHDVTACCLEDSDDRAVGAGDDADALTAAPVMPHDPLCIIYTSGTTGAPKGVVFTHRMLRIASEAAVMVAGIRPGDRAFMWEPLCHIGGAQMLMMPFLVDADLYVVQRFSASRFWSQWQAAGATHLHYLGGVLDVLMQLPDDATPPPPSIRTAWGAGVPEQAWDSIRARFGCELRECYGMTECSSFATFNASGRPGSIGKALPWMTVQLLDESGQPVAQGDIGEMVLSSDLEGVFFPGYLDNPEATRNTLRDGRLYTGDLAREVGDGDYLFVGRRTDSMRVRGENVSAWEVERVFAGHPAIEAVAAVGVSGRIGEQEILLYVQFRRGAALQWAALVEWARPRLATFQLPRYYTAIEQFDLTPSQRVRKHMLPKSAEGAWERNDTRKVPQQ
jgi:crotonobetaine/carnitine-CoA ligase